MGQPTANAVATLHPFNGIARAPRAFGRILRRNAG